MIKSLTKYFKEYKIFALLTPVFLIAEVLMEVLIPGLMSQIIDVGIENRDIDLVVRLGLIMIAMAVCGILFGMIGARVSATAGTGFALNLRGALFEKVQSFSFSNVEKFSTGSLLTRLTADVINTQNAFISFLRIAGRSPIMLIAALVMSLRVNVRLTLVLLLAVPAIILAFVVIGKQAFPRFNEMLTEYDNLNGILQENFSSIRVVKSFVREDFESEKFDKVAERAREAQRKAEYLMVFAMPLMQLIMYSCLIVVFWFGGRMVVFETMGVGQFLSMFTYVTQILMSLIMIAVVFIQMVMSRASMMRIVEVLDENVSLVDGNKGIDLVKDGSIVFENVSFSYGESDGNVLNNINLSLKSGDTIGIIGSTGTGKSTLVQLIPRLYDVSRGRVLVGGKDVKDYNLKSLRDKVAMVLQNNVLFSGTIKDNLLWGNPDASQEEIEAACRIASADEFVKTFPEGYDTWLEQGGVNLSGGQKQRLCIARALLKNPHVIIMDDSTSAVDTATDASIRRALNQELVGTTAIIIAQRIASVEDADCIVVLSNGEISAQGTHEELMKTSSVYQEIYHSQRKGVAS